MTAQQKLLAVRHGIPVALLVAGLVVLLVESDGGVAVSIWAMFTGAALAIWLIGALLRIGFSGDRDRDREDEARRYFDEHGHWPDEKSGTGA